MKNVLICLCGTMWINVFWIKLPMNKMNTNQIAQRSYYCCCLHKLLIIVPLVASGPVISGPIII